MIATQTLYQRLYVSLQQETNDVFQSAESTAAARHALIERAHREFQSKRHACSICYKAVMFADHLTDSRTKAVGGVFMCCQDCAQHNLWTQSEASLLWALTPEQVASPLNENPCVIFVCVLTVLSVLCVCVCAASADPLLALQYQ